jgi:hypothetical protein
MGNDVRRLGDFVLSIWSTNDSEKVRPSPHLVLVLGVVSRATETDAHLTGFSGLREALDGRTKYLSAKAPVG